MEILVRRNVVLAAVIAVMVTISILFVVYVNLYEPDPVWDELTWNIEEGDSLAYRIVDYDYYLINNTVIIANITDLPQYSIYYTSDSFASSIIEVNKVDVLLENGSELVGNYERFARLSLSHAILPCGEWELLDMLYVNPENASFGPTGSLTGYISKLENDYFLLGYEAVDFDSSRGWNAHISLETGLPFYKQYWKTEIIWTGSSMHWETRITKELFLEVNP